MLAGTRAAAASIVCCTERRPSDSMKELREDINVGTSSVHTLTISYAGMARYDACRLQSLEDHSPSMH